jgi:hypothetical protein
MLDLLTPEQRKSLDFWANVILNLTSCDEACEIFPDMGLCPVCGEMEKKVDGTKDDWVLVHKSIENLIN